MRETSVDIVFHRLDRSPAIEGLIHGMIEKAKRLTPDLSDVRVVVDAPHRHDHRTRFAVKVEMKVGDRNLFIDHEDIGDAAYDPARAVRDAFVRAMRQAVETAHREPHRALH